VAGPLGPMWLEWGHGRLSGPSMAAMGAWPVHMVLWAPYGRCGGVDGLLDPVWPPWTRCQTPGTHMAAVNV